MYLAILAVDFFGVDEQDSVVICVGRSVCVPLREIICTLRCGFLSNPEHKAYLVLVRQYNQLINFWSWYFNCPVLYTGYVSGVELCVPGGPGKTSSGRTRISVSRALVHDHSEGVLSVSRNIVTELA